MIKVGDKLPAGTLNEFVEVEGNGCSIGPNSFDIQKETAGKTVAVYGLPGAFTPTCSAKHVPSYLKEYDALRAAGVDEIWCHSVNDAFVMGAWGREQKATGKVRMMGDGAAQWARALGLDQDLSQRGLGVRAKRYAMVVDDGVDEGVTHLRVVLLVLGFARGGCPVLSALSSADEAPPAAIGDVAELLDVHVQ